MLNCLVVSATAGMGTYLIEGLGFLVGLFALLSGQ
jgi:hypothetical protein